MRKFINLFLAICLPFMLASCTDGGIRTQPAIETDAPTQTESITPDSSETEPFEGRMGIISYSIETYELEYYSAMNVIEKYGEEKIGHRQWPQGYTTEMGLYRDGVSHFSKDKDVRALIIHGGNPYIDEAIKEREDDLKDIFVSYIRVGDDGGEPAGIAKQVDIVLRADELGMGIAVVHQAQQLGAKTFVHYSIPRHMDRPLLSKRRELIKEECAKLGIEFVDATAPDAQSEVGVTGVHQFILEDVPKIIAKYGKDTALFSTGCVMQEPLIKSVIDGGAIYPSPCHPSPYHGLAWAFDLENSEDATRIPIAEELVTQITEILAEKNMLGRLSTWPVDPNMMSTEVSAEYAVKWINGEVPKEGIDLDVLKQLMEDYAGVEVYLTPYTDEETGETYDNYLLVRMDYITF